MSSFNSSVPSSVSIPPLSTLLTLYGPGGPEGGPPEGDPECVPEVIPEGGVEKYPPVEVWEEGSEGPPDWVPEGASPEEWLISPSTNVE